MHLDSDGDTTLAVLEEAATAIPDAAAGEVAKAMLAQGTAGALRVASAEQWGSDSTRSDVPMCQ